MSFRRSTVQVALACALGALACGVVAIKSGYNIWFGILAGLITGYMAYEFRAVVKAVPQAFAGFLQWVDDRRSDLAVFNAVLAPCAVLSIVAVAAFARSPVRLAIRAGASGEAGLCTFIVTAIVMGAVAGTCFLYMATALLAAVGIEYVEKGRIVDGLNDEFADVSYGRFWTLVTKGAGAVLAFLLWRAEIALVVGFWKKVVALAKALWTLFKLIHRYERVLCAIDGTLGGVVAYVLLIRPERSLAQNAVAVLFGMVLGVGWGLINYEVVSKRILKVVPVTASR